MSASQNIHTMPIPNFEAEEALDELTITPCREPEGNVVHVATTSQEDGDDPVDLFGRFPPPELPIDLLPDVIRNFTETRARQIGCDPSGLAVAALTACAAAIPDNVKIKVQAHSDKWHESARLWAVVIGPPSSKKTPLISAASESLRNLDQELFLSWRQEKLAYNRLPKEDRLGTTPPPVRRLVIEDTTVEAAQGVLIGSTWGICILQDELSGFFGAMEKYSGAGAAHDRSVYMRGYNGGPFVINRKKNEEEGGVYIPNLSISILGGIQPDVIRRITEKASDDGLIQRFLPIILQPAKVGADVPAPDVTVPFDNLVRALHRMKADTLLSFDETAQAIFEEVQAKHVKLQAIEMMYTQLASHIGKYDGIFARLCVVWHCIENPDLEALPPYISGRTASRVREFLHGFLLKHAFSFYAGTLDSPDGHDRLRALAAYILAHRKTELKNRDVQSSVRTLRGLKERDIRPLFEQLAALGWLKQIEGARAGSPPHWRVNPRVHVLFEDKASEEIRRRREAREIISEAVERRRGERSEEC
ncbi:DUF3987 domain-containing protein [Sulfitobacter sp. KE34]|uniref:DUF3987 domain-containing protein n=1 Tax=unclassified Sulfitobacter TaxID=196795 RepID=UPI0023E17C43|nr:MULTISPECIES: DUF3987 domain-containing protein [unclassified Sulfitobacter]MDF3351594.1 DUF3987 domain-containing protein [Sulfitobacter sp. KE12]MDF3355266.1 DUF3987 domain-containing protein [Sulfitobacter sp. KE27]MDF3358914.1 DUF3987 domain-containing protein [Sulfitobacter sp. KE33]MDF3366338.1 DUF3987 domain-containing protein [Sulfitobacter sp. Ks34]MDF3369947.1 DUF3987 domain-containing protein [Sulfitobacter sp. Ks43]